MKKLAAAWEQDVGIARLGLVVMGLLLAEPASALMRGEVSHAPDGLRRSTLSIETPEGICTGTLIGPRLVVTAGHCVAHSGRYRLSYADPRLKLRTAPARRVQSHPGFDIGNGFSPDDIGLIELAQPLPASMLPATLPSWSGNVRDGEDLVIAGFGSTELATAREGILREAVMQAGEPSVPGRTFAGLSGDKTHHRTGMCVGDSGGPVYRRRGKELVLVGILKGGTTEGGRECTSRPVYTPINLYVSWVRNAAIQWGLTLGPATPYEMKR